MNRYQGWVAATVMAVALAGCATTVVVKHDRGAPILGESHGRTLTLKVGGFVDGARGVVRLKMENHNDDPVGVDVDAVRLVDEDNEEHAPLGRSQSFRDEEDGKTEIRRVPYGAATLPPGGHLTVELEFQGLPDGTKLSLAVPKVYRIGIDGQEDLPGVKLPLRVDPAAATATAAAPAVADKEAPPGWFDPFVDW